MTEHNPKETSRGNVKCRDCGRYATSESALEKTPCEEINRER